MFVAFVIFYVVPLIVVLLSTASWSKKEPELIMPLLLSAVIPIFNIMFAVLAVVMNLFIVTQQRKG